MDGRVRYLRNVGRPLAAAGVAAHLARGRASRPTRTPCWPRRRQLPAGGPVVDVDAPEFLPPGDMPSRIRAACAAAGQAGAGDAGGGRPLHPRLARSSRTRRRSPRPWTLSGQPVDVVHIVGGGCQNALLCQLTADLSGRPVLAGPIEATALGNLAVQARAAGVLPAEPGRAADGAARRPRPGPLRARGHGGYRGGGGRLSEDRAVHHLPGGRPVSAGGPGDRAAAGAAGARGGVSERPDLLRPDARQHRLPEGGAAAGRAVRRGVRAVRGRRRAVRVLRRVGAAPARDGGRALRYAGPGAVRSRRWRRGRTSCPSCWSTCWG